MGIKIKGCETVPKFCEHCGSVNLRKRHDRLVECFMCGTEYEAKSSKFYDNESDNPLRIGNDPYPKSECQHCHSKSTWKKRVDIITCYNCRHENKYVEVNLITDNLWISVEEKLPVEKLDVLVIIPHRDSLTKIIIAKLYKGLSSSERDNMEDCERKKTYYFADEDSNNTVPYSWKGNDGHDYYGQSVSHWCEIPKISNEVTKKIKQEWNIDIDN